MKKVIIASKNQGKINEFKELFKDFNCEVLSLDNVNFADEIVEEGQTFYDNALIKAETIYKKYHIPVIADDSGLCVYALNLRPGIYSARYSGKGDLANNQKLLEEMKDVKDRRAYFEAAICLYVSDNQYKLYRGILEGEIGYEIKGDYGFGYDKVFYLKEYDKYSSEISLEEKNKISHRAKAFFELKKDLDAYFNHK